MNKIHKKQNGYQCYHKQLFVFRKYFEGISKVHQ